MSFVSPAQVAPAYQERYDNLLDALVRQLHRLIRFYNLHALGFGTREAQISFAHARVKLGGLRV